MMAKQKVSTRRLRRDADRAEREGRSLAKWPRWVDAARALLNASRQLNRAADEIDALYVASPTRTQGTDGK